MNRAVCKITLKMSISSWKEGSLDAAIVII
jgi:hypothetical protein